MLKLDNCLLASGAGPFNLHFDFQHAMLVGLRAAFSAARPAAKGVLLRAPLKPTVPAEAQERVSPLVSVMVTMVLLNVALI